MTTDDQGFGYETGGDDDLSIHRIATPGKRSGTIGPRPDHVVFWLADGRASLTADDGEHWEVYTVLEDADAFGTVDPDNHTSGDTGSCGAPCCV